MSSSKVALRRVGMRVLVLARRVELVEYIVSCSSVGGELNWMEGAIGFVTGFYHGEGGLGLAILLCFGGGCWRLTVC